MISQLDTVKTALAEAKEALDNLLVNENVQQEIVRAAQVMIESLKHGGKILSCGNGG